MGGWVVEKVEEEQGFRMRCCTSCMGGWVGGWVGGWAYLIDAVGQAKTRPNQPIVLEVSLLLRAALHQHQAQLHLLPVLQIELHQLVGGLFKTRRGHNRQVDGALQVDQVLFCHIVNDLWGGGWVGG